MSFLPRDFTIRLPRPMHARGAGLRYLCDAAGEHCDAAGEHCDAAGEHCDAAGEPLAGGSG